MPDDPITQAEIQAELRRRGYQRHHAAVPHIPPGVHIPPEEHPPPGVHIPPAEVLPPGMHVPAEDLPPDVHIPPELHVPPEERPAWHRWAIFAGYGIVLLTSKEADLVIPYGGGIK